MEQPQKVIEVIGRELEQTCSKLDELQADMDKVFDQAKTNLGKLAAALIDLASDTNQENAPM